ncbi:MAG: transposase [Pseudonocardiales bacterium]|nr:transposase [Pseudonocardiales bacterium]
MERIVERPGALDVHKASVTACVRVWTGRDLGEEVAEFKTTVQGLLALRDWLEALGVRKVAMEATGVYWKPVWAVLEDSFELTLVNARHVKAVPGRKTDIKDAQWLCQLLEAGLLRASFVPPKPIRTLRNLTRYRKAQIQDRSREAARLHKMLEDAGIKLSSVATDIMGKSGRDMLDALVAGTTDPVVLADLARGLLRKKIPALQEALEGRFSAEHSLIVSQILAHIDFLDESIDRLSAEIEQRIAPFAAQRDLLMSIPGVRQRAAEVLISEIGVDMSIFATPKHLASWAKMSPGNDESAGKRRSGKTGKGNKWLRATLTEAALAAGKTKNSYLAAQYQRLRGRRGHNRAVTAVGHSILTAIWHMLQTGELYNDPGNDYFTRQNPDRLTRRLVRQLEALGHNVILEAQPTPI